MISKEMQAFTPYQTDELFLLVGSNPLPNYVAARLLAREHATLYLLHTTATATVAERLARRLGGERSDLNLVRFGIPEADGPAIERKVKEIVQTRLSPGSRAVVGLNYTGGTKPMAVYTALALRQAFPRAVFSYLDARKLSLVVDSGDGTSRGIPVGRSVVLQLKDMADLHGYRITQSACQPRHLAIAQAIAEVHLAPDGLKRWRAWLETWRDGARLPTVSEFPTLAPAIRAFNDACGGSATEAGVAEALGFAQLAQCGKYFAGEWLEDHSLAALAAIAADAGLDEYAKGLLIQAPGRPDFELDLAVMINYQLFGLACVVTEKKEQAKDHLLEVVTRAGQLGGEEARFAVISFYNKPEDLEKEVTQDWDAVGRIKVFGPAHIRDLSVHLLRWFREANQEVS